MIYFLFILSLILILSLSVRLHFLRKGLREIGTALEEILSGDTNLLLTISSRDKAARALAARLNRQLSILRSARQRYELGDTALKEAVTNLSHDLRTPLTAISGYLELLKREPQSDAASRYLRIIEERTVSMRALTEELLCYSIARSTPGEEPVPLSLNHVLEDNLLAFYGTFVQAGITPVIHMPEEPVLRTLDASSLNRVLQNILNNAAKYSAGSLTVTLRPDGAILFSNPAPQLTPVQTARLFDRFYTVEHYPSEVSKGIGLSIARSLTERMGGSISAEYKEGELHITVQFPQE